LPRSARSTHSVSGSSAALVRSLSGGQSIAPVEIPPPGSVQCRLQPLEEGARSLFGLVGVHRPRRVQLGFPCDSLVIGMSRARHPATPACSLRE
jgi:hypothetical protein